MSQKNLSLSQGNDRFLTDSWRQASDDHSNDNDVYPERKTMKLSTFALLLLIAASLALTGCSEDCDDPVQVEPTAKAYIGSDVCASCHAQTHDMWAHSGHPYKLTKIDGAAPSGDFPNPSAFSDNLLSIFSRNFGLFDSWRSWGLTLSALHSGLEQSTSGHH